MLDMAMLDVGILDATLDSLTPDYTEATPPRSKQVIRVFEDGLPGRRG